MSDPRQNPTGFTSFTFTDNTGTIQGVKLWYKNKGDSTPTHQLTPTGAAPTWTWTSSVNGSPNVDGVYFRGYSDPQCEIPVTSTIGLGWSGDQTTYRATAASVTFDNGSEAGMVSMTFVNAYPKP